MKGQARLAAVTLVATALVLGCTEPKEPLARGQEVYAQCAPCHGAEGAGDASLEAPPLAGTPAWYVEAQLGKFREGVRGTHADDAAGMRMRPMSLTLAAEESVKEVAAYIASMKPASAAAATALAGGNADQGKARYATCVACHGPDGAGNQALNAPAIAGLPDWYVFSQLGKFKHGIRGAHPKDTTGAVMRGMVAVLPDEQSMKDMATYVASLPRKN